MESDARAEAHRDLRQVDIDQLERAQRGAGQWERIATELESRVKALRTVLKAVLDDCQCELGLSSDWDALYDRARALTNPGPAESTQASGAESQPAPTTQGDDE